MDILKNKVDSIFPEVTEWRRHFHKYPELSNNEKNTSETIARILEKLPLDIKKNIGGYGVVAELKGDSKGKTIAVRADMDALPIQERNEASYSSGVKNIMHACGHDGHISIVLGIAHVLSEMKNRLKGNVKFIFQPAEENAPNGGAKAMIESDVLKNPDVDAILGVHIWPDLDQGKIGIKKGQLMASSDYFKIEVFGKNGHASAPNEAVDTLFTACKIITTLQSSLSRILNPLDPSIVSVGTLKSGVRYNIISDYAVIEGTVRTLCLDSRRLIKRKISDVVDGICKIMGAEGKVDYEEGYPILNNDSKIIEIIEHSARESLDNQDVVILEKAALAAEDFANYLKEVPGAMIWLGSKNYELDYIYPLHNPKFNFDESILKTGINVLSAAIINYLDNN
ncbi:M20 metallopeptidase family protein [Lutispora saccharofermentans]|uniref:Amidohydrolase n=1 Tax=Lutispora saccharofermentans TaxID=3024236 RepID=A0ABT1NG82_9FIRM|nr:amidohydrolase [Lutispora saccharofermentans]MCQ1530295.1 amidohydrolase [Lutispora saccharofermentans]